MRTYAEIREAYGKEDCEALQAMPLSEAADLLDGIEGAWMPKRPGEYYDLMSGRIDEAELDFYLLKACIAIKIAARELRKLAKERETDRPGG